MAISWHRLALQTAIFELSCFVLSRAELTIKTRSSQRVDKLWLCDRNTTFVYCWLGLMAQSRRRFIDNSTLARSRSTISSKLIYTFIIHFARCSKLQQPERLYQTQIFEMGFLSSSDNVDIESERFTFYRFWWIFGAHKNCLNLDWKTKRLRR